MARVMVSAVPDLRALRSCSGRVCAATAYSLRYALVLNATTYTLCLDSRLYLSPATRSHVDMPETDTRRDASLPDHEMPYMHIVTGTNRQYKYRLSVNRRNRLNGLNRQNRLNRQSRLSARRCPKPPTQLIAKSTVQIEIDHP